VRHTHYSFIRVTSPSRERSQAERRVRVSKHELHENSQTLILAFSLREKGPEKKMGWMISSDLQLFASPLRSQLLLSALALALALALVCAFVPTLTLRALRLARVSPLICLLN